MKEKFYMLAVGKWEIVLDIINKVFKIEDNALILKFNSSDIYNQIKIGQKYRITTTGVRNNFMSWYRNINSIELYKVEE